ncbi:hypothetical protein K933_12006 [Candidatus Halobonum tyrrellensis G22]|uniref:Uncharacterized protein n=1 Tax=Candidatus Halobonum tyrrellensis G22 TaxID=1324957 RepID=V4IXG7_9EURY|nr:hypothetical protein K933_12006 [Candidatus Halobonum tyrrellensis G22]
MCGLCEDGTLASAAADRGATVETGASTLDVRVFANGSTRWTARVELTDGAGAMANESLRRAVVRAAIDRPRRPGGDASALSSRMDGSTLVASYDRADAAETELGAVVFTPLHASGPAIPFAIGGEGAPYLASDALTVHAPAGYVPAGGADGGNVSGDAVRWTAADGDTVDGDTVPTFVPEGSPLPGVRGALARLSAGYGW